MASLRTFLVLAAVFMLFSFCEAKYILVGGSENAWKIPNNSSISLNLWAEKHRFRVGDFLIWKYDDKVDSVLQVTKENYLSCNTSKPIKEYKDGDNTKVELDESGPFYFISGADSHCKKGQKLVVVVMSEKHDNPPVGSPIQEIAPLPAKASATRTHAQKDGFFLTFATLLGVAFAFAFV